MPAFFTDRIEFMLLFAGKIRIRYVLLQRNDAARICERIAFRSNRQNVSFADRQIFKVVIAETACPGNLRFGQTAARNGYDGVADSVSVGS